MSHRELLGPGHAYWNHECGNLVDDSITVFEMARRNLELSHCINGLGKFIPETLEQRNEQKRDEENTRKDLKQKTIALRDLRENILARALER